MRFYAIALTGTLLAQAAAARAQSPVKEDESVVLFPSSASRFGDDWEVELHGWVFEPEHDSIWRRGLVKSLLRSLRVDRSKLDAIRFRERVRWFLVDNERGKRVPITIGGNTFDMPASGKEGHFRARVLVPDAAVQHHAKDGWLPTASTTNLGPPRHFRGAVRLTADVGWMVISDIDDTIKITGVTSKRTVLRNTFLEPFRAVPGMATLFQSWEGQGATFHYLSAGPWQLYPLLSTFLQHERFPRGTFTMREFRVKDRRIRNLLRSPKKHKRGAIEKLLRRYPKRKFVLVGDAWEKDPEVFGGVARAHRKQIRRILLRRGPNDRWSAKRARKVFRGVEDRVTTFEDAAALPSAAYRLP